MKIKNLIYLIFLLIVAILPHSFAQDNTKVGLPEGAIARLGKGGINIIRFSPNGKHLAVGTDIGLWLYDVATGEETALFSDDPAQVNALVFSQDGKMIATGGFANPKIQLWDIRNDRKTLIKTLTENRYGVSSLSFSNDGKTIRRLDKQGRIAGWNIDTGEKLPNFNNRIYSYHSVVIFSEKDNLYAIGESSGRIRIFNASTNRLLAKLLGHSGLLQSSDKDVSVMVFTNDAKMLASGGYDKTVRLWNINNRMNLAKFKGHESEISSLAFTKDGRILASGDTNRIIKIWDTENSREIWTLHGHTDEICALAFSPDGNTLASGCYDGTIRFWNPHTGKAISTFTTGHIDAVKTVTFSDFDNDLLSLTHSGSVDVWEGNTLKETLTFSENKENRIRSVALSSDNTHIAVIYNNRFISNYNLKVWNLFTGMELQGPWSDFQGTVNAVSFSPDSNILVVNYDRKGVFFWHINAKMEIFNFKMKYSWNRKITFSPDGNYVFIYGGYAESYMFNAKTMEETAQINTKDIKTLVYSPDSTILATLVNNEIILWDVTLSGIKQRGRIIDSKFEEGLVFSPDGKFLLSITEGLDRYIQVWGVNTGWNFGRISGHTEKITTLDFSNDGKILACGSLDGTILLWDWEQTLSKLTAINIGENNDVYLLPPKSAVKYNDSTIEAEAVKNWLRINGYVIKKSISGYRVERSRSLSGLSDKLGNTYRSGDLNLEVKSKGIVLNRDDGSSTYVVEGYEGILQIRVKDVGLATFLVDEKGNFNHNKPDKDR